jgi:rhodanese-related sulfurtransferase
MSVFKMLRSAFTPAERIAPADAAARVRSGQAVLIDVREPEEWAEGVAKSAALLPLSDFNGSRTLWRAFLAQLGDREALVYCASGARSGLVARMLVGEGVRAANTGRLSDWAAAGWPIVPPPPAQA